MKKRAKDVSLRVKVIPGWDDLNHLALWSLGPLYSLNHRVSVLYKCELCGRLQAPRTPSALLSLKTKTHQHPKRERAYQVIDAHTGRRVNRDDPGGVGLQIVRQARCCPRCAKERGRLLGA